SKDRTGEPPPRASSVGFLFPGQGALIPGAGAALYGRFAAYRKAYDEVAVVARESGVDLVALSRADSPAVHADMRAAQLLLFAAEYALAALLVECGITPAVVTGHSLGEYAAACVSGVLDVRDAARLVEKRADLMAGCPPGMMIAVSCA